MATILERFKGNENAPQLFNYKTTAMADGTTSASDRPVIKGETSERSSCPYTNEEKDNGQQMSVNGLQEEKPKDSPVRSLSPEFLLGSSEKTGNEGTRTGETEKSTAITCVFCNETLADNTAHEEHTLRKHYGSDKRLYDCSVCEKQFTHRSSRDIHLRVHTGQRPYECEYCKKRFRVSSHLRDHVRTHTGERPFKCEVCGRGFKQSSDMKKHKKTHFKTVSASQTAKNTEASYMIVRPEYNTAVNEHTSNGLRSPTDQRQNLKLVIKRERKPSEMRSPTNVNGEKTLPGNSTLGEEKPLINTVSGNRSQSVEKPSEDSTPNYNYSIENTNSENIASAENNLPRFSPAKLAIKRKLDSNSKSRAKNGYKTTPYPSMASGFGHIYTSSGLYYNPQESPIVSTHNPEPIYNDAQVKQSKAQTFNSGSIAVPYEDEQMENRISYDHQPTTQTLIQKSEVGENNDVFCQPEMKKIKTEKLSPNSREQSTHCDDFSTPVHELQTASYEQRALSHEKSPYNHEQAMYSHDEATYSREQSSNIHERSTGGYEPMTYTYEQLKKSLDSTRNVDHEHTYNCDVATTQHEDLTSNQVDATKRADDSSHTETQALPRNETTTGISEGQVDALSNVSGVAIGNVAPQPGVTTRKTMAVKLRRDKNRIVKTARKPTRLSDEGEDVRCSVCEQLFKNLVEFTAHKCNKNAKAFNCTICSKTFARQTLLRQHMVLHQGSKRFRFKCNYCGRAFRHRSHLRDHERIHTGERPFKCSFCPKAFKQSSDHRKHENLHTGTTRYRCEKCSLDFKRCDALKRHAMMHTKGEVTLLKCEKCRSLFATTDGHMSHVCLKRPYRYRCQICPERFTDADDLRRHCYNMHGEQSTLSCLKCEFCKLEFNSLEKLDEHLGTHRLKKTHRCRTCDQKFSLLNQLVEHVKTHSTAVNESVPAFDGSEVKMADEIAEREDPTQPKEASPNVTATTQASNEPARRKFDFIPSKYQPLVHTNTGYGGGELPVGTWVPPHSYYLQLHPRDNSVPQQQAETPPISPRHQTVSSQQHTPISPRQIPMSSPNDPISSRSNVETRRKNLDIANNNNPISSRSTSKHYRTNGEPSEKPPISARSDVDYHRPDAEHTRSIPERYEMRAESSEMSSVPGSRSAGKPEVKPVSSERDTIPARTSTTSSPNIHKTDSEYARTSPTINAFEDAFSSTSFAAYHAIALSRSMHKTDYSRRKSSRNEAIISPSPKSQTNFHKASPRKQKTASARSISTIEDSRFDPSEIHNNVDPLEDLIRPEEGRRYSDDSRLQSEVILRRNEHIPMHSEEIQIRADKYRSDDDITIVSERIRSNSGSSQNRPINSPRQRTESRSAQTQADVKRKYTCLNCRSEFYHESALVDHVCDIFSETLYSCLVCKDDFEKYEDLQEHMRIHWRQVVYLKCTMCGLRLRSEELLKKHNLKHLEDDRTERSVSDGDKDGYRRLKDDRLLDGPPETFVTPSGSAKSVTSPVICSVSGNVVTKTSALATDRRSSETDFERTNQNAVCDDVISRSGPYIPYYEARKQAPGYLNVLSQGQAMVMSAMHAAMETSGRYHVPEGIIYPTALGRSRYKPEHH
ncbi:zinc finger protein Xfin-like [Dendronephthya gigantea]|uniref:zinc finger protein Xfin-like n=1 Tax=Dendronephthya gigantea TaxID=151771 RepID=UPI00106C18DA|nr:zinc finger protein Xfin-like [Dendronephthya gigantea]